MLATTPGPGSGEDPVTGLLGRTVGDRLGGERPSAPKAMAAAFVAGAMVATITYRLLRQERSEQ